MVRAWAGEPKRRRWLRTLFELSQEGGVVTGWIEFRDDGIWYVPGFVDRRGCGVEPERLVAWDEIWMIDLYPSQIAQTSLTVWMQDRRSRFVAWVIGSRCEEHLRHYGFQPHSIGSWPDRRLWTRTGEQPDWTAIRP